MQNTKNVTHKKCNTQVLWGSDWRVAMANRYYTDLKKRSRLKARNVHFYSNIRWHKELLSELIISRENMTGAALCNGVFITDQCKESSAQCDKINLYAGLAKEVNFSTY